jgi:hypothetical protein
MFRNFPNFLFFFFSISLLLCFSLFLPHSTLPHAQDQPAALRRASSSQKQLASTAAGCPSRPTTPTTSPCPLLLSSPSLPWRAPTPVMAIPLMESFNQARFTSWDDQIGCAQPSSCNPHPQFYLKRTLISGFCDIWFFK